MTVKRVVIDTNILISSILSPHGSPARVMELISDEEVQLVYSSAILAEYKRVLAYDKLDIEQTTQMRAINEVTRLGVLTEPVASETPMPDEDDRAFYDTAKSSGATLITGNTKHYSTEAFITSTSDYLSKREKEPDK